MRWCRTPTCARLHDRAGDPSERPAQRPATRSAAAPARRLGRRLDRARRRPAGATCRSGPWRWASGESVAIGGPDHETAVVLVSGPDAVVTAEGSEPVVLEGRASVFDGLPSAFYLPAGRRRDGRQRRGRGERPDPPGHRDRADASRGVRGASGPSTSGLPTSASRSAVPGTRRARSTTSSPPTSRPTGCCWSRS